MLGKRTAPEETAVAEQAWQKFRHFETSGWQFERSLSQASLWRCLFGLPCSAIQSPCLPGSLTLFVGLGSLSAVYSVVNNLNSHPSTLSIRLG